MLSFFAEIVEEGPGILRNADPAQISRALSAHTSLVVVSFLLLVLAPFSNGVLTALVAMIILMVVLIMHYFSSGRLETVPTSRRSQRGLSGQLARCVGSLTTLRTKYWKEKGFGGWARGRRID